MSPKKNVGYYLILSAFGALLMILVSWFGSTDTRTIDLIEKLVVGGAFITSCVFGISLAVRPGWFRRNSKRDIHGINYKTPQETDRKRKGHHPDCKEFKSHTINAKYKTYCAGCLGLTLGSIISIILMVFYVIVSIDLQNLVLQIMVFLGLVFIVLNYTEILIPTRNAHVHAISNAFLVIGFLFTVIGAFKLTGSVVAGIAGVIISFLWLDTRIQLSNWRHALICENCNDTCKAYHG